jgi:hypothetical protein
MTACVLSYAEAEEFDADLFFYDYDLSERDLGKSPKRYCCLYCDTITQRSAPSSGKYLFVCEHCGWWQVVSGGGGFGLKSCKTHRGRLREYLVKKALGSGLAITHLRADTSVRPDSPCP